MLSIWASRRRNQVAFGRRGASPRRLLGNVVGLLHGTSILFRLWTAAQWQATQSKGVGLWEACTWRAMAMSPNPPGTTKAPQQSVTTPSVAKFAIITIARPSDCTELGRSSEGSSQLRRAAQQHVSQSVTDGPMIGMAALRPKEQGVYLSTVSSRACTPGGLGPWVQNCHHAEPASLR